MEKREKVCCIIKNDDANDFAIGQGPLKDLVAITNESVTGGYEKDLSGHWFLAVGRTVLVTCYTCPAICAKNFGDCTVQYIAIAVKPYYVNPVGVIGSFDAQEFLTYRFDGKVVGLRADGTCVVECTGSLGLIDNIKIRAGMTSSCVKDCLGYREALPVGTLLIVSVSKACPGAEFEWIVIEPEFCDIEGNPTNPANHEVSSTVTKAVARPTFGEPIANQLRNLASPVYQPRHACNSKGKEIINISLSSVMKNVGSVVRVSGWAYKIRKDGGGGLVFMLRDGTGCVLCVAYKKKCEPLVEPVEKQALIIRGKLVNIKDPRLNKYFAPYPAELCCDSICFEK